MGYTVKTVDGKVTPTKKNINLKNISVKHLVLVDADTGEDITSAVIDEIPSDTIDFKLSFEIDEDGDSL